MRLTALLLAAASLSAADIAVVLDSSNSPNAILHPVPVNAVSLAPGFWTPRRKAVTDASLPILLQLFEEKGILDNFRRTSGSKDVARRGPLYTDSDVYKWLEAVAYVLMERDEPKLRAAAGQVIGDIAAAQEPSGYINTYYTKENLAQRHENMRHGHELYCLGHLVQAGIAWKRATGDTKLMTVGARMADYLTREFGPGRKPIVEGHPEIELALIELYRETGSRSYLDFAGYMLGGESRIALNRRDQAYLFTGVPFTSRIRLEGHAVRAMYACAGATDYYLETGDPAYRRTLDVLWNDMAAGKMYLTGGVGSRASGEAFGEPYELPNQQAYTESCASIATMFWNWRMALATGEAKYMNLFERALYNGANSGLSLNGALYCYRNPLELTGNPEDRIRNPWYDTTCCPPNLQRILASLPGYFYSTSKDGVWVHLFHAGTLKWRLEEGIPIELIQQTGYPWQGAVTLTVKPQTKKRFALRIRIPDWAAGATVSVNGAGSSRPAPGAYFTLDREWSPGDVVTLALPVQPRLTAANPLVRENVGRVAVEAGPIVYCMEGLDQPDSSSAFDWWLSRGASGFRTEWRAGLLGGVNVITHPAAALKKHLKDQPLYHDARQPPASEWKSGTVTFIPYYTFANREPTSMQVWVPVR